MSQSPEDVMDHEKSMALHQAGLQRPGRDPADRARLIDKVVDTELEVSDDALQNLAAKDFPLGNYEEEIDTTEYKWMQEILDMFVKAQYPHPQSGLQGLSRAWAAGDTSVRNQSLGLDEVATDEAFKLGTFSRAKRGEDMAQQETSAKQVNETHAISEDNGSSSSGILGRWRS